MAGKEADIYGPCDRAIQAMNRENLEAFGRLKTARFDQIDLIRTVTELYRKARKRARQHYYEEAFEVYLLMMAMLGRKPKDAAKMADKAIDGAWVDGLLKETDPVTLYQFDTEMERKAQRLIEALGVVAAGSVMGRYVTPGMVIDRALKDWSRQTGQYAIDVTDAAMIQALQDDGQEGAFWVSQKDGRVCHECRELDGKWFPLDEIPIKPHWGCRCRLRPGSRPA